MNYFIMKNLEIKIKLDNNYDNNYDINKLKQYYSTTLTQEDIYFISDSTWEKLKIRIEPEQTYAIYYKRELKSDEKISQYEFYPIDNFEQFMKVFGKHLQMETIVKKRRKVYLYKNARIHIDDVDNLGMFLEVEVVISSEEEENSSHDLMKEILELIFRNESYDKIDCGYRDLLIKTVANRDLLYYNNTNKVFWYVNDDIIPTFKKNDIVPCLFVERMDGENYILQLDQSIIFDNFKYTMWRKTVGEIYSTYVDVFLIKNNALYDLKGCEIDFNKLKRSTKVIDQKYLAKFK